jgi:hypothetical protein
MLTTTRIQIPWSENGINESPEKTSRFSDPSTKS